MFYERYTQPIQTCQNTEGQTNLQEPRPLSLFLAKPELIAMFLIIHNSRLCTLEHTAFTWSVHGGSRGRLDLGWRCSRFRGGCCSGLCCWCCCWFFCGCLGGSYSSFY